MMKYRWMLLVGILILSISISVLAKVGPSLDSIIFDVRMQEDIGIQDTAAGKTDIFYWGLGGPSVKGLDRATLDKLEMYAIPSGSWSLLFNPIPNAAPYTVKVADKEYFNPLAIREVRYAMNWLINRQYIADEILAGTGIPTYTMATPGQPGTYKYNVIASKLGYSAEGDEKKALAQVDAALTKAAALDALKGKLKKGSDWWTYNGEPVSIKFLIRVDDPNGRLKEGQYVANQIEKAKIKVDRLLWDRSKCAKTVYYGNPADYTWGIYTEGWGAGATRAFWDNIVCQMYAPFYGNMPGGGEPSFWNYTNDDIDKLAMKAFTGDILTDQEYWDTVLKAQELGLTEAVRIYVMSQTQYYLAKKDRFLGRFAYGLGDGLNKWSLITAKTKDGKLKATQFSAKGSLFMDAWDPVGPDGFNSVYSNYIAGPLYDEGMFESPVTAMATANRAVPVKGSVQSKVHKAGDKVVGDIEVPTSARAWDSAKRKWVSKPAGTKAMSTGTYELRLSNFHDGSAMSMLDYMYADAFVRDWVNKDGANDPYYDEAYSSTLKPTNDTTIATLYDFQKKTITTYFDYNFPADMRRVELYGSPGWTVTAAGQAVGVAWQIIDAMARMVVTSKSASNTVYSFSSSKEGTTEVDVLSPKCVADIKAELQKMIDEKYVPKYLAGYITAANAAKRYQASIKFIGKYGHAYISNGPFYMAKFDTKVNYAELKAFRDSTYPFNDSYWSDQFKSTILSVDKIEIPSMNEKGKEISVKISVSQSIYPSDVKKPATQGKVSLLVITNDDQKMIAATKIKDGLYEAKIPASLTSSLAAGSYTILAMAELPSGATSTANGALVVY